MPVLHALKTNEITDMEITNQNKVRALAGECVVVLENDGVLPLSSTGNIALFGNGARHTIKGGTGSGDVNSRSVVNVEMGLKDAGFNVTTTEWLDTFDKVLKKHQTDYMENIHRISVELNKPEIMCMFEDPISIPPIPEVTDEYIKNTNADTAIYVIARDSGEGGDRWCKKGDYLLSDDEVEIITKLGREFKNTIVLLNIGGIINVQTIREIPGVNAIVNVSQLGNIGGLVIADVLLGKSDPSGRLADTWAVKYEDYPGYKNFSHNNGNCDDEYYEEGIYIGYRYFDTFEVEPLYPFGYGLGYTTFDIKNTGASIDGTKVTLSVEVTNTGVRSGKETVQVYVSAPFGKLDKPYQELIAYKKTSLLDAGSKETLNITFDIKDCASFDEETATTILEAGEYYVRVGKNSRSTDIACVVVLDEVATTLKQKNLFKDTESFEMIKNPNKERQVASFNPDDSSKAASAPKLMLKASDVPCVAVDYSESREELKDTHEGEHLMLGDIISKKVTVEEFVAQLTVREMAQLCVGSYLPDDVENVVGAASRLVPGAAAETNAFLLEDRGIPSMILADGPAGLRLQPHFKATPDGFLLPGGEVFGLSYNPFPDTTPADAVDYYQYCTAIPIATALAQTWNTDLIYDCGKIVGEEMKKFYVHFWLAPGMNIHRNPLCGRNFEYYSEDPLISGLCAAYDTLGVQSYPGQGTTIKHFAGNNQEENRMYSNSHISERALRDVYLKGFGYAIKISKPYSIMTSYNRINGVHTANSYDLLQNMARDEYGFDGVVMTDWFSSQRSSYMGDNDKKYVCAYSEQCISAGNDWQMPGSKENFQDILTAIDDGRLSVADLQFCTANVIKMAVKCFE